LRVNLRPVLLVPLLALVGCAGAQPAKSPVAEQQRGLAEMTAIARRLPPRVAAWVRVQEPQGDPQVGLTARYRMEGTGAWASVFLYHPDAPQGGAPRVPIAPGPDGPEARRDQAQFGEAPRFEVTSAEAGYGGAVVQRCAVLRQMQAARPYADYVCSAGVGGFLLKLRVTAPIGVNLTREWAAADQLVGILAGTLTRAASGDAPTSRRADMQDPATGPDDT
jgi:hypothetical protein